ncbi:MAG: ABC transporter substrate-binding protein [Euryarchaeota archaeon]|nr:ABC transporter substrate-binding protein [Euryarchaeota archaeon]
MVMNRILTGIAMTLLLLTLPAAASDYTLGVFGNANEDDTINMQDVTYTELIILEYRDETELADAKYDDKINMQDVTQIELVILGREKELTLIDGVGRIVTVEMPVERIIPTDYRTTETMLAIGAEDMIVGVDRAFHERMSEFGLSDLPEVSMHGQFVDYEVVLMLDPDLVVMPLWRGNIAGTISKNLPNTAVVVMGVTARRTIVPDVTIMGMLFGKEDEASELIGWIESYDEIVEERTEELRSEELPTLYYEYMSGAKKWWAITPDDSSAGHVAEGCGCRNIAAGLPGRSVEVDPEWVIEQNPDVMFADLMKGFDSGPGKTEADMEELLTKILADRPGFENVNAVKDGKVYLMDRDLISGPRWVVGHIYFAKWLHPGLFGDIDPEEIHNEYLETFHDLELEGTWAYPLPE